MLQRLRRWLIGNVEVHTMPVRRIGAALYFFEDGSATIESTSGFVLNRQQNEAMREFTLQQMEATLEAFESARRKMDNVIPMPMSKEIN